MQRTVYYWLSTPDGSTEVDDLYNDVLRTCEMVSWLRKGPGGFCPPGIICKTLATTTAYDNRGNDDTLRNVEPTFLQIHHDTSATRLQLVFSTQQTSELYRTLVFTTTSSVIHICQTAIHATLHRPRICSLYTIPKDGKHVVYHQCVKQMLCPLRLGDLSRNFNFFHNVVGIHWARGTQAKI